MLIYFRANALPFIQRGAYSYINGERKSKPYNLLDIRTGNNLTFDTRSQPTLSNGLKSKKTITIRITSTDDDETRNKLLFHGCKTVKEKEDVKRFIKEYMDGETTDAVIALRQIQGFFLNFSFCIYVYRAKYFTMNHTYILCCLYLVVNIYF